MFTEKLYPAEQIECVKDGVRYVAKCYPDNDHGMPWEEEDGHGEVSEWTTRDKAPGELILCEDGQHRRYYDFAGAVEKANNDGWGSQLADWRPAVNSGRKAGTNGTPIPQARAVLGISTRRRGSPVPSYGRVSAHVGQGRISWQVNWRSNIFQECVTMTPQQKFQTFRAELGAALIEREGEIDCVLSALLAGEHPLLVGPPGGGLTKPPRKRHN